MTGHHEDMELTEASVLRLAAEIGDLLTVREAARLMRVSRQTVYRWIETGEIQGAQRVGPRSTRIPAAVVRERLGLAPIAA